MSISSHEIPNEGKTNVWLTPPEILARLGPFDPDPCAAPMPRPWATAKTMFLFPEKDGLKESWFGRVWLNPPCGPHTIHWLGRLAMHGNGIALVFARTETEAFHRWVWPHIHAALFIKGRLHFHDLTGRRASGNAGAPSVLLAYGMTNAETLSRCGITGQYCFLKEGARR